ncbi:MAG: OPT/YSL family transporter, partial [Myxococcota bacterium]|nr:OPT/YSL family transporter [Myxococcota bacterium]
MYDESTAAEAPPLAPYRELTVAAAVFGVLIGAVMTAAFTYVALKLGFTLAGSTVAAILGFAVLRGALKKGSIIENNINQTIASGINTAGTGIVFTVPALFMLDAKWKSEGLPG